MLTVALALAVSACTPGPKPPASAEPSSVGDAKRTLERKGWSIRELGGGVKFLAKDQPFDAEKAMEAFAMDKRGQINGVVFVSYSDDSSLVRGIVARQVGAVWVMGESTDVEKCMRALTS